MSKSTVITTEDLPSELAATTSRAPSISSTVPALEKSIAQPPPDITLENYDLSSVARILFQWARGNKELKIIPLVERELIIEALKETGGNQVQTAKLLGITRATLRKRIEKFKIQIGLQVQ